MNTFDFNALVRSMNMKDIQEALDTATKLLAEEQERERKAAEEAERKRREAEAAKQHEEARENHIKRITAIANAALFDSLTADDIAYLLRQYARAQHPDFPAEDFEAIFDADTIENYVDLTTAVFNNMKFLLPSGIKQAPGKRAEVPGIIMNFDETFKQLFSNHEEDTPAPTPQTDDEVLRNFIDRILK